MLARCAAGAESGKGIREMDEKEPEYKKRSFFECFPYVCPEPVLVKCSFLCINGSKRPFVLTVVSMGAHPNLRGENNNDVSGGPFLSASFPYVFPKSVLVQ